MAPSEAPQFIAEVMALGDTHAERAERLGVHLNTISAMARSGRIPKCVARYLPYPNILAALHRDSLAYIAEQRKNKPS
jgi:hypothetical protein